MKPTKDMVIRAMDRNYLCRKMYSITELWILTAMVVLIVSGFVGALDVRTVLGCFVVIALVSEYRSRQCARLSRQLTQLEEYMEKNYG